MECPWYVATAHQKRIARDLILASDRQVTPGIWQIWQIWHFHQFHQQSDAFKSWQTWERMDTKQARQDLITGRQSWLRDNKNLDYGTTKILITGRQKQFLRQGSLSLAIPIGHHCLVAPSALRPATATTAACEHIISDISLIDPPLFRLHTTDTCHNIR